MTESVHAYMTRLGQAARQASRVLARASTAQKNRARQAAANALDAARTELTAANELDLAAARASGLEPAKVDRLALTPKVRWLFLEITYHVLQKLTERTDSCQPKYVDGSYFGTLDWVPQDERPSWAPHWAT